MSIKQKGPRSKTGPLRGNKDYESAALTIELRAQTVYLLNFKALISILLMSIVTIFVVTVSSNQIRAEPQRSETILCAEGAIA
jgi:hypothetical protein